MESIEVEGATVEQAVKKALSQLKVPRNCVQIKVVSEEKRGLFGMKGAKPAKVRVTVIKKSENT
ncbi:MAG: Jag N-terminal domain-containing protein [Candidatus Omnitrophota bacterium]|nr:Jag N-terminal domain-containing protein [Candidatus Omnitrophota bacterium]